MPSNPGGMRPGSSPAPHSLLRKRPRCWHLYAGLWDGQPLGPRDYIISADEKTSIQARIRCHPTLSPAPGRHQRVEFESDRGGALQYLAAWDVGREGTSWGAASPARALNRLADW